MRLARSSFLVAALAAAAWPAAAAAHANLLRSQPANGAVLAHAPTEVRLVFDDTVRPLGGAKAVRNGDGSILGGKERRLGSRVLVVPLRRGLRDGDYSVAWRAISDDGHTVAGVLAFAVGAGRAPPSSVLKAGDTGPSVRSLVSRWLFLFGLLTAVGAAAFQLFVWRRGDPARLTMLMLAGFVAAFLGASALIPHQAGATRFGVLYEIGAVIALVGGAAAALGLADRRARFVPPLAALALLPVPSLAGHALDAGNPRPLMVAIDIVHTGAAAVWVGGLLSLVLVFDRELVRRFSILAFGSVAVLSATGVMRAVFELSSVSQLWSTGYGRALLVKTALLAILVVLGGLNRYRLLPRLGSRDVESTLRRSVRAETVLVAGIVVAVAFLTALPPGRRAQAATPRRATTARASLPKPLPGALVLARQDGKLAVALAVRASRLQAIVLDPNGQGLAGLRVSFRLPGKTVAANPCGAGCYSAAVNGHPRRVAIELAGGSYPPSTAVFTLPRSWRPASALVRRATSAFERASSVVFEETLSSQPGNQIRTTWKLAAPNRFSYTIRGGPAGIVIGARRWDKVPGGPWQPSPQTPLPQPKTTWGPSRTNAYLLQAGPRFAVVSFFDPQLYAWFTLVIDRKTFRPREMRMTTAAHFMHHSYLAFNHPVRIRPPR
jgi:copper transport protein